jgi:hypothetical protein
MNHRCHHCDYDLLGLSDRGHCPECGNAYDKHSSYRVVRAHEPVLARDLKWITLAVITLIILLIGGVIAVLSDRPWGAIALTLVIAGVSGFGAFTYWWSERQERKASQ